MTLHFGPSQRAKTLPCSHAWGFTAFVIVVPHNLHVKRTCSMEQSAWQQSVCDSEAAEH